MLLWRLTSTTGYLCLSMFALFALSPAAGSNDDLVSGCIGPMPPEICEMVDSWVLAKERCGEAGPDGDQSCDDQLAIMKKLNGAGYFFGCADELSSQRYWRNDCNVANTNNIPAPNDAFILNKYTGYSGPNQFWYIDLQPKLDRVTINAVVVNRGNCSSDFDVIPGPKTLVFGQRKRLFLYFCNPIELILETNEGTFRYEWDQ